MNKSNAGLTRWIKEAMVDEREGNPCRAIGCVHKEGARDVEVYTVTFTADKTWEAENLAAMFEGKAADHVAEVPGTQLFYLYAFYGDSNEPRARRSFRVNNSDVDFGYGTSEPPTPQGQLMQAMRHAESSHQFSFRHTQFLIEKYAQLAERLMNQNNMLAKENVDAMEVAKVTILQQAQFQKEQILEAAKKQERVELMKMLPPVINRAVGEEVFPQSFADTKLVEAMLSKLDEKTIQLLASVLPPELMRLVAARAAQYHEEKNRAEQTAQKAITDGSNGTPADPTEEFN